MAIYYLNVYNGITAFDHEGIEFIDLNAARSEAIEGLRGIVAEHVREGRMPMHENIQITDAVGLHLATVTVADAIDFMNQRQ